MLDYVGGPGRGDTAGGDRDLGRVQFLQASGDTGEDGDDSRRGEPRAVDPGYRCGMERAGVSRVRVALPSSRGPVRRGLADPQATIEGRTGRFRGALLSGTELRDRATRTPSRGTPFDGRSRQTANAQADRAVRRPLEHRLHGQT